ncbi:6-phosphogluconolactonase Pgl [Octadecabacter antarcticus 307]|uniref:6-phosphogluconolactonase n=1 Tax=Octadecabacter antarcticus 307 TaxID=391626 RepID=M9RBY4_9RHOB|nr:6-phosphogluconolactonase [Octadecabacter antarcticus]AGI67896.1 6-phosphogluconolactonase Pgl [Octadecabacter antarcticus 307]
MNLIEYPDAEMMMMDVGNTIAGELEAHLLTNDSVSFAVPGGTTPGPIFDVLCGAKHIDWARVHVMLTDERWVPETSERSNTRLLRERLLIDAAAAAIYMPLYGGTDTPEESLAALEAGILDVLPISVLLLGMGTDMHTASIFPGADKLNEALHGNAVLVPMRAPGAPEPRITLSAKVLKAAMSRHIVIIGQEKREALNRAKSLSPEEAPIAALLAESTVHWAES